MQKKLLSLVLTLMMTVTSQAQETPLQEDFICAGTVITWSGTVDETESIEANLSQIVLPRDLMGLFVPL